MTYEPRPTRTAPSVMLDGATSTPFPPSQISLRGEIEPVSTSLYLSMRDGVQIAVDVWRSPNDLDRRLPAIVSFTRYWRAFRSTRRATSSVIGDVVDHFTKLGYAVLGVDVRGTGASSGARDTEWGPTEMADFGEVIDWIAGQVWSNGKVATIGTSYSGNTAELAAATGAKCLKAVVPRFSDFSEYQHAFRPGGVRNKVISDRWVDFVRALDANDGPAAFRVAQDDRAAPASAGVRPVGDEEGLATLDCAIRAHEGNVDLAQVLRDLEFSDDIFGSGPARSTMDTVSPTKLWRLIDADRVPAMHWASWFDGGTADGVLTRYINYDSPLHLVIGAWNHGGTTDADPYNGHGQDSAYLPCELQFEAIERFLAPFLKGDGLQSPFRQIDYFTLGSGVWRTTAVWPPDGVRMAAFYPHADGCLDQLRGPPTQFAYVGDPTCSTGPGNRWQTQLGVSVNYGDRRAAPGRLLRFTTAPLAEALEVTGSPVVRLRLSSSTADGMVIVYLEDVFPDGSTVYLKDGVIRLGFRSAVQRDMDGVQLGPHPRFSRDEFKAPEPGEPFELVFTMNPTSVTFKAGHRLQISLSAADAGTYAPLPQNGELPTYNIYFGGLDGSIIELPLMTSITGGDR